MVQNRSLGWVERSRCALITTLGAAVAGCGGGGLSPACSDETTIPTATSGDWGFAPMVSPDGNHLVFLSHSVASSAGTLVAHAVETGVTTELATDVPDLDGGELSADGAVVRYFVGGTDVVGVAFATGEPVPPITLSTAVFAVDISPDGSTIVGSTGDAIVVFDGVTGAERARFPGAFESGRISPDGSRFAYFRTTEKIELLDLVTGDHRDVLTDSAIAHLVDRLDWLPDGRRVITVLDDGLGIVDLDAPVPSVHPVHAGVITRGVRAARGADVIVYTDEAGGHVWPCAFEMLP